jgi:hydrogenase-4 component E
MNHAYDVSHLLAGLMLVVSFMLLYQSRILAVVSAFALQAVLLALAVAWEAWVQERHELYVTAMIALGVKAIVIPLALRRIIVRLGIQRQLDKVVNIGATMLIGIALTALSLLLVLKVTKAAHSFTREGLALALAVVLLGFLMMITRRNAVSQIVGFMSIENGLILAATGARGMPLVVEISVAFSVVIALLVFSVFVFGIRERFDSVDVGALHPARGEER